VNDARVLENIIASNIHGENTYHLIAANNIISNIISGVYNGTILNNIVFGDAYWGYPYYNYYALNDCNNTLIENNIFTGTSGSGFINCTNDVFNNNVYCRTQDFGANSNSGNFQAQDYAQFFVNASTKEFKYQYNYQLKNPGNYTGTDATEVSIYGGLFGPAKTASVPMNPHIYQKTISNKTNNDGTLDVNIKVKAQSK
jgi:hypothetical protein